MLFGNRIDANDPLMTLGYVTLQFLCFIYCIIGQCVDRESKTNKEMSKTVSQAKKNKGSFEGEGEMRNGLKLGAH